MWFLFALIILSCIRAEWIEDPDVYLLAPSIPESSSIVTVQDTIVLFAPGVQVTPEYYQPIWSAVQEKLTVPTRLWTAFIRVPFDVTLTQSQFEEAAARALQSTKRLMTSLTGAHYEKPRVIFAGHSRGVINIQDMLYRAFADSSSQLVLQSNSEFKQSLSLDIIRNVDNLGLIMLSGTLQRKYRPDTLGHFLGFDYRILSLSGDLDGLFRVSRMAESLYHCQPSANCQVWVIRGASHASFAGGNAPAFVRLNDLKPELCPEESTAQISNALAVYIKFLLSHDIDDEFNDFSTRARSLLQPFILQLRLEGSYHLKPTCNSLAESDPRRLNALCWRGSAWSEQMQSRFANLSKVLFDVTDAFWKVWLINPVHLPQIYSGCEEPTKGCRMNITTVTQLTYGVLDGFDSGLTPTSADEMRVKMKSRQSIHIHAGLKNANFTQLDDNNHVCQQLNQYSLEQSLKLASKEARERYTKYGDQLVMGEDLGPFNAGPSWIWKSLQWSKPTLNPESGKWQVVVRSPSMRTPEDYFIKLSAGFHYCKLLSPARALEWIYIDSLRRTRGLTSA
jgi:hypothetical protein